MCVCHDVVCVVRVYISLAYLRPMNRAELNANKILVSFEIYEQIYVIATNLHGLRHTHNALSVSRRRFFWPKLSIYSWTIVIVPAKNDIESSQLHRMN